MADPNLSDAQRDSLFERLGVLGGLWWLADRIQRLTHPRSDQIMVAWRNGDEGNAAITAIELTDIDLDTDTDPDDGFIYGTYTDGGAGTGHTIALYANNARSSLAATTGATVDDGATGTLTAQTGYTLTGTVTVGAIAATANFVIVPYQPIVKRIQDQFPGTDGDFDADADMVASIKALAEDLHGNMSAFKDAVSAVAADFVRRQVIPLVKVGSEANAMVTPNLRRESAGNISFSPTGLVHDLLRAMEDNTGGSGAILLGGPTITTPSGDFTGWSGGRLRGTPTANDRQINGTLAFVCVQGLENNAGPRFRAYLSPDDIRRYGATPGIRDVGPERIQGEFELTVNQLWQEPKFGITSLTIEYAPTITNSSGTPLNTTSTNWTVVGLKSNNSDSGKLWCVVASDGTTLRFYDSEANRDADDGSTGLVTQGTGLTTATAFTSADLGNGLVVSGTTGATFAAGNEGDVDFNAPQATDPASYFEITLASTVDPSDWVQVVRDGLFGVPYRLNSGSANIQDGKLRRGIFGNGTLMGDIA